MDKASVRLGWDQRVSVYRNRLDVCEHVSAPLCARRPEQPGFSLKGTEVKHISSLLRFFFSLWLPELPEQPGGRAEQTGRQRALFRPPLGGGRGSEAAAKSEVKSQSRQNEPGSILGCLMSHFSQTQHWESLSLSPLAAVTAWLNSEPLAAELIWEQLLMQLVERREAGPAPPSARRRNK